jgi:Tfp pilus assembly protein PilN
MAKTSKTKTPKRRKPAPLVEISSQSRSLSLQRVEESEILQSNQYKSLALRSMFWRPDYLQGGSAWVEHIPFAFWIVEALQPSLFVELGTHYGHSYFSFCQAIKRLGLNTPSYAVDTWKGDDQAGHYDESVYQQVEAYNQANYPEFSSLLRCTFDEALCRFSDASIDLLHIDGFHTYEAVRHDFESWLPKLSNRSVVLFHDTNVRRDLFGVHKYFAELTAKYPHFEFIHGHGLGVLGVGKDQGELLTALYNCYAHQPSKNIVYELFSRLGRSCHDLMDLKAERESVQQIREESSARHQHIVHLEQIAHQRSNEVERLTGELGRVSEEIQTRASQIAHLESVVGERGSEIDRLTEEIARITEESNARAYHTMHLEQVAGERGAEVERIGKELREKSETLDRYIQESAQMARMIIEAQDDRDSWRKMSVTAEIEEVIPGPRHEVGEHQHINYTLLGITHLGRKFSQIDVRIVEHRGNPGVAIMEPVAGERPFYAWERHGEECGRGFILIIPTEKKGREWLVRATTNDLLLTKDIVNYIQKDLLQKESDQKWCKICTEVQLGIDNIPMRLHYDNVKVLGENNGIKKAEIVNPSIRGKMLQMSLININNKKIINSLIGNSNILIDFNKTKVMVSSRQYIKEQKNIISLLKKLI